MKKEKYPIARAGIPYITSLIIITIAIYFLIPLLTFIPGILLLFCLYFFRNPKRRIFKDDFTVLSPADGKVMGIYEIEEDFMGGRCQKVSIFLSLCNVHLNRSPVEGKVIIKEYRPGKYIPAFKSHASDINEKSTIGIMGKEYKFMVSQITGFIARRIKCYANPGDLLEQGEHFGIIRFGSCTEIILPTECEICLKIGDKVRGGETVVGRLPDKNNT